MTDIATVDGHSHDQKSAREDNIAKLLRMAGQIADFFKAYPDAEAVPAIADHINQFWTARMRADFRAAYGERADELSPLLRQVLPLVTPARSG